MYQDAGVGDRGGVLKRLRIWPAARGLAAIAAAFCFLVAIEAVYRLTQLTYTFAQGHVLGLSPHPLIDKFLVFAFCQTVNLLLINNTLLLFELASGYRPSPRRLARSILFWLIFLFASYPVIALMGWLPAKLHLMPLIPIDWRHHGVLLFIYPLIWDFFHEFFVYWTHRAQHAIPFLWKFHEIHHSQEDLSACDGYHHISEYYVTSIFVFIPMALIVAPPTDYVIALSAFYLFWGQWVHSRITVFRMPSMLRGVIADNVYHHYHHAADPKLYNLNFAQHFSFWDWVFGTQYLPACDALPRTGVPGSSTPATVREFLLRPFKTPAPGSGYSPIKSVAAIEMPKPSSPT